MNQPHQRWYETTRNKELVTDLRAKLAQDQTDLLIFLGAGLSYGVGRLTGRGGFDEGGFDRHNDHHRFPSWNGLITRMHEQLRSLPELEKYQEELRLFFQDQGPLDCAELFRSYVKDSNYFAFLQAQFQCSGADKKLLTPSHKALVQLAPKRVFTTNYDELIELAFQDANADYRRSISPQEFMNNVTLRPATHIMKLHGSIDQPQTVVLTRMDYAKSRRERVEMFSYLATQLRYISFLFVGFSLSDPNFTSVHDDARLSMGGNTPASYAVQGRQDTVKDVYLRSVGVNTISLGSWNLLPQFLNAINPKLPQIT